MKIEIETIQYRKARIWKMKERSLAKNRSRSARYFIWEMLGKIFYSDLKHLCIEKPCWCSFEGFDMAVGKPTETSVWVFCKGVNLSLEELTKIKVIITYSQTEAINVQMAKLNLHESFLAIGHHLNSASRKSLANCLSVHYLKTN